MTVSSHSTGPDLPPAATGDLRRRRCCRQKANVGYFTPIRRANSAPESLLFSNSSSNSSRSCAPGLCCLRELSPKPLWNLSYHVRYDTSHYPTIGAPVDAYLQAPSSLPGLSDAFKPCPDDRWPPPGAGLDQVLGAQILQRMQRAQARSAWNLISNSAT